MPEHETLNVVILLWVSLDTPNDAIYGEEHMTSGNKFHYTEPARVIQAQVVWVNSPLTDVMV